MRIETQVVNPLRPAQGLAAPNRYFTLAMSLGRRRGSGKGKRRKYGTNNLYIFAFYRRTVRCQDIDRRLAPPNYPGRLVVAFDVGWFNYGNNVSMDYNTRRRRHCRHIRIRIGFWNRVHIQQNKKQTDSRFNRFGRYKITWRWRNMAWGHGFGDCDCHILHCRRNMGRC